MGNDFKNSPQVCTKLDDAVFHTSKLREVYQNSWNRIIFRRAGVSVIQVAEL